MKSRRSWFGFYDLGISDRSRDEGDNKILIFYALLSYDTVGCPCMLSCTDSEYIFTFSCLASFYHFQTDGGEKRGEGEDARDTRIEGKPSVWSNKKGPTERVGFYGH